MKSQPRPSIGIRMDATNAPRVDDFLDAIRHFHRMVEEVDRATAGSAAVWALSGLSYSSPAQLVMEPIVQEGDKRALAIDTTIQGLKALATSGERPPHFTDEALYSASSLAKLQERSIELIELFSDTATFVCSPSIAANIQAIFRPAREMIGSITGRLEAMNSHNGFQFNIYEPVWGRRIGCTLVADAPEVLRKQVVALYEQRVRVAGLLRTNAKGEVAAAKIDSVEQLPSGQRFTNASEIAGLYDITGGLSAEEYIRRGRDA